MIGVLWLIAALPMAACAVAVLARLPWWQSAAWTAIGLSFLMCIVGWPEARIGVFVNTTIGTFLLIAGRMQWLQP